MTNSTTKKKRKSRFYLNLALITILLTSPAFITLAGNDPDSILIENLKVTKGICKELRSQHNTIKKILDKEIPQPIDYEKLNTSSEKINSLNNDLEESFDELSDEIIRIREKQSSYSDNIRNFTTFYSILIAAIIFFLGIITRKENEKQLKFLIKESEEKLIKKNKNEIDKLKKNNQEELAKYDKDLTTRFENLEKPLRIGLFKNEARIYRAMGDLLNERNKHFSSFIWNLRAISTIYKNKHLSSPENQNISFLNSRIELINQQSLKITKNGYHKTFKKRLEEINENLDTIIEGETDEENLNKMKEVKKRINKFIWSNSDEEGEAIEEA